jgi:hypothetical protein
MATTNTTPKFTKAQAFAIALEALNQFSHPQVEEAKAKIVKEIENISKKSSKTSGTPTKAQQANAVLAEGVAEFMAEQPNRLFTISELSKECPAILGATPQKIRPLLTTLIAQKQVERTEEKGKPMFKFIGEGEE